MSEDEIKTQVVKVVMRLIDFGKGALDHELEKMSLGDVADRIIEIVRDTEVNTNGS